MKVLARKRLSTGTSILDHIDVEHGPASLLGRFFATAYRNARDQGLELDLVSLDELASINRRERENWLPIVPTLDPSAGHISADASFAIIARTSSGSVVAAHGARLFDWPDSDIVTELTSLRLFYETPALSKQAGEICTTTATLAREITGRVVYSGAAWIHPSYRGRHLTAIVPRFAKALALTQWNPRYITSLMTTSVFKAGFFERFGYQNIDWDVSWTNSPLGSLKLAIVWMDMPHLIHDLTGYLEAPAEVDRRIRQRDAG